MATWRDNTLGKTAATLASDTTLRVIESPSSSPVSKKTTIGAIKDFLIAAGFLRDRLSATREYFVRTDGNDNNTGLVNSAGGAFLTLQRAVNVVAGLDTNTFNVTITLGAGTFAGAVLSDPVGAGAVTISGQGAASTTITGTNNHAILADNSRRYLLRFLKVTTTTSGSGIYAYRGSFVRTSSGFEFGACASAHVFAANALVSLEANYTISGNAVVHWWTENLATISAAGLTIALTGTPAFTYFSLADFASLQRVNSNAFSGSATGTRYYVAKNSTIATNGAGATYLPGNVNGTAADASGVYL